MTWEAFAVQEKGAICEVVLQTDRIGVAMVNELERLSEYLEDESPASVLVLRGRNGRFTHGIDLGDFSLRRPPDVHGFNRWERALRGLEQVRKVTVAVLEGACRGGGVQLALVCDYRLATPDAVLCLDEVKNGFLPGLATWRLSRHVGLGLARELVLGCREVEAARGAQYGLVSEVCSADELERTIERVATSFMPVNGTVVALARRLLDESFATPYEDFLGSFLAAQHRAISGETFMRRLQEEALRPPPRP